MGMSHWTGVSMIIDLLVRYVHFVGLILLSSSLVAEHLLISKRMKRGDFKRLAAVDRFYGISALITLVAGLLLWFVVGKPKEFYNTNFIFHIKVTLFVTVGIISIFPTVFFIKKGKENTEMVDVPQKMITLIRIQLVLLIIMPFLAVLMASGVGLKP